MACALLFTVLLLPFLQPAEPAAAASPFIIITMVLVSSAILGAATGTGLALVVAVTIVVYRYYLVKREGKEWAELEEGRERRGIYGREIYLQVSASSHNIILLFMYLAACLPVELEWLLSELSVTPATVGRSVGVDSVQTLGYYYYTLQCK